MKSSVVISLALWGMLAGGNGEAVETDTPKKEYRKVEADRKWRRIYNSTYILDSLNKAVIEKDSLKKLLRGKE